MAKKRMQGDGKDKSPIPPKKSITFDELKRLSLCNSKDLPPAVEILRQRHVWVGFGWVNEGALKGDEVLVID